MANVEVQVAPSPWYHVKGTIALTASGEDHAGFHRDRVYHLTCDETRILIRELTAALELTESRHKFYMTKDQE